jgi:hypothetical protein
MQQGECHVGLGKPKCDVLTGLLCTRQNVAHLLRDRLVGSKHAVQDRHGVRVIQRCAACHRFRCFGHLNRVLEVIAPSGDPETPASKTPEGNGERQGRTRRYLTTFGGIAACQVNCVLRQP